MKTIKFSHQYRKILDSNNDVIDTATLLQVIPVNLEDLSQPFLDYDTDKRTYALPKKGKIMMLLFLKPDWDTLNLFTTLRQWTPESEQYYRKSVGEAFIIESDEVVIE
jgi:hypothetical protein